MSQSNQEWLSYSEKLKLLLVVYIQTKDLTPWITTKWHNKINYVYFMATTSATWYQKFTLTASFARRAITAFGRFRSSGFSAIGTKSEKKITFFPLIFTFSISKQFITNAHTVEPRCNKPLYNKVVSIMNNFVYPSNRKIYGN